VDGVILRKEHTHPCITTETVKGPVEYPISQEDGDKNRPMRKELRSVGEVAMLNANTRESEGRGDAPF